MTTQREGRRTDDPLLSTRERWAPRGRERVSGEAMRQELHGFLAVHSTGGLTDVSHLRIREDSAPRGGERDSCGQMSSQVWAAEDVRPCDPILSDAAV